MKTSHNQQASASQVIAIAYCVDNQRGGQPVAIFRKIKANRIGLAFFSPKHWTTRWFGEHAHPPI